MNVSTEVEDIIEIRHQATTGEDTVDWESLVRAVVNCRVCELAIVLELLVFTICKCSINPITNPNSIYSQTLSRDNIVVDPSGLQVYLPKSSG
jgi:hypothetical protein